MSAPIPHLLLFLLVGSKPTYYHLFQSRVNPRMMLASKSCQDRGSCHHLRSLLVPCHQSVSSIQCLRGKARRPCQSGIIGRTQPPSLSFLVHRVPFPHWIPILLLRHRTMPKQGIRVRWYHRIPSHPKRHLSVHSCAAGDRKARRALLVDHLMGRPPLRLMTGATISLRIYVRMGTVPVEARPEYPVQ